MDADRSAWNRARYVAGARGGHYESWFQRANHPSRPLAFWIRYTIFSPRGRPADALGELWAIAFDGERQRVVAVKEEHPIARCSFSKDGLDARIADARLDQGSLEGRAKKGEHAIAWTLRYSSRERPLLLLPERLYGGPLPRAKALVGSPLARFDGTLAVDGETVEVDGWVGSQNHNWGSQHTDRYAWGQVAGFDDAPEAFLEVTTARVKVGPVSMPWMTPMVLRLDDEEIALNALGRAVRARAHYAPFEWRFESAAPGVRVTGTMSAPSSSFVALPYLDPPGGIKTCLNTKIARCELRVQRGDTVRTLSTVSRAAFEILSADAAPAGVQRL